MTKPNVRTVNLSDLVPEPRNARTRDEQAERALDDSLDEYGAARSIVVDGDDIVRAGNGTLKAARAAGIEEALVVETNGKQLVVVKRADWDEETAVRYGLSDNQTALLAKYDFDVLKEIVVDLQGDLEPDSDGVVSLPGFSDRELKALLDLAVLDPTPDLPGAREVSFTALEGDTPHECPRCGFRFKATDKPSSEWRKKQQADA